MKKVFLYLIIITSISLYAQEKNNQQNQFSLPAISVTIGGKFIVNGTYPAMFSERVDQFITRVYNLAKENSLSIAKDLQTAETINKNLEEEYAIRGILLKSVNGEEKIIDLAKFRANGDFKNNPYLKNDDVIIFPAVDLNRNFVRVLGAINNPIKFMFVDGDKLSDALEFAQGINKAYENVNEAIVYRLSYDGTKFDSIKINLSQDLELKRGDRVRILADETKRRDYFVNVIGEVKSPGIIPITNTKTTIREIISMAGGFTPNADIPRAEIIRGANAFESLVFSEDLEKLLMLRMSNLVESDSLYFLIDEKLRFMRGNGLVDFTKIFNNSLTEGNFIVQNFDAIYVPPKIDLVYVYGQVNRAGYSKYFPNKNYQYYLDQAGGIGESAVDVYIIKGQSRSWIAAEENPTVIVEPGDYIWVSKKTPRTFWYHVGQAGQVASILGGIATVILLFVQIGK
jgi:protein involved in polysaccharide export with SLBB domain